MRTHLGPQQVGGRAAVARIPTRVPSSAHVALLISMVLLAAASGPRNVSARSLSELEAGQLELRGPAGAQSGDRSGTAPNGAASERDLESATISHAQHQVARASSEPPPPAKQVASELKLAELNESLRALNEMVGESRLGPQLAATANASALDLLELMDESAASAAATGDDIEQPAESVAAQASLMKQSLVRQLSDFMMNHDQPEVGAGAAGAAGAAGETRASRRSRQLTDTHGDDEATLATPDSGAGSAGGGGGGDDSLEGATEGPTNLLAHGLDEEGALITCPPDYDERNTLLVPTNISELFGDSLVANVSSLTAEQRQQLLSGADAGAFAQAAGATGSGSGSGPSGGSGVELNETALLQQQLEWQQQQLQQHRHLQQLRPACRSVGMARIDVITKTITPILFGIIIVIGLVGNVVVMLVILEERKLERELTPTNLLILDLSLADLSFIIFCIPFTGWDYATGYWAFGSLWCKLNQYLIVVCALSSIYTLVLMSCDRFMAIVYPIECISYRTSRNMMQAIVIKWIAILLAAAPAIQMHGLISSPIVSEQHICRFLSDRHNPLHFQIVFFLTSYLFPLVLIFGLYLSLLNKLWFGQKPQGHKESHKMLESKKKVTWLVASIVIVFAVCWCPIQIMLILMRLKTIEISATYIAIQVFAHTLGYMNSCVNPIVYAFASETFYQSFRRSWLARVFCFRCCAIAAAAASHPHYYGTTSNGGMNTQTQYNQSSTIISHANYNNNNNSGRSQNFKQFAHHPADTITLSAQPTGASSYHKLAPRSSLQINRREANTSHLKGHNGQAQRNTSLNHIFEQPAGVESPPHSRPADMQLTQAAAPKRPPLEPRDRDQIIASLPLQQAQLSASSANCARRPMASSVSEQLVQANGGAHEQQVGAIETTGSCNAAINSNATNGQCTTAKQQLVARVVRQSSFTGNQVVAHQCEPPDCQAADY